MENPSPTSTNLKANLVTDVLLPSLVILTVIVGGIATGWKLSEGKVIPNGKKGPFLQESKAKVGQEVGSKDKKAFRDKAEGVLEKGGIDGEGTHHLVRDGGSSQFVYITSSVVDLDEFVGKKIEVWGETFAGQKAGWLMDVGRIKILE